MSQAIVCFFLPVILQNRCAKLLALQEIHCASMSSTWSCISQQLSKDSKQASVNLSRKLWPNLAGALLQHNYTYLKTVRLHFPTTNTFFPKDFKVLNSHYLINLNKPVKQVREFTPIITLILKIRAQTCERHVTSSRPHSKLKGKINEASSSWSRNSTPFIWSVFCFQKKTVKIIKYMALHRQLFLYIWQDRTQEKRNLTMDYKHY